MEIYALANSKDEAWFIYRQLGLSFGTPYAHSQGHIDCVVRGRLSGVYWWKEETPPDFNNRVEICHVQGKDTKEQFLRRIKRSQMALNVDHLDFFYKHIKPNFPQFNYYSTRYAYSWYIRYKEKSNDSPVILDRWEREKTITSLTIAKMKRIRKQKLRHLFPYLVFYAGTMKDYPEYLWNTKKINSDNWVCWILRSDEYGDRDGASTNFSFSYPPTKETIGILTTLNTEGGKAQSDDMFFCSSCQKALPRAQYAYYHFACTKCVNCATPEWLNMARNESYN